MTISLQKGANCALPDGLGRVRVVLGWTEGPDLDASALLLRGDGKVRSAADLVFQGQPSSTDGSITHLGRADRDDTVLVDLTAVPADVETISITASAGGIPFGSVRGLHVRLLDDNGTEVVRFTIPSAGGETAFVLGQLYRRQGAWKFRAVGQGWASGFEGLATSYGLVLSEVGGSGPGRPPPDPQGRRRQRMEWHFNEGSVLSIGHWYLDWGDPEHETLLTLTQVIYASDNPIWCLKEHAIVLRRIISAAEDLLADLAGLGHGEDGMPARLLRDSPMVTSVLRAHHAVHHAMALLVDALVECRKGPVENAMLADATLSSSLAFVLSEAVNCTYRLEMRLPRYDEAEER